MSGWNATEFLEQVIIYMDQLSITGFVSYKLSYSLYLLYFYGTVLLIVFLVIDIIYITYCFQIKIFNYTWPLYLLRNVCGTMVTVLFLPFTG